jgi:hypothetical protein
VSTSYSDLSAPHSAYTHLSERFKSLWTFHQFLQAVHKGILGDSPGYSVDFQGIYDQVRTIGSTLGSVHPVQLLESVRLLEVQLDAVQRKLAEDDARISPHHVRRFFERMRTEDEKVLLSILRFYFSLETLDGEALDKFDFLITLVGARTAIDDGRALARFPQELQKLFSSFIALGRRLAVPQGIVADSVGVLAKLKREIEECEKFEDLASRQLLESLRDAKRRLGPAIYSVEVLSAILEANLAAKNKFRELYEVEERRILESSRQLLEAEQNPRFGSLELQEEFRRFRKAREEFDQQVASEGLRHREVQRLADAVDQLTSRLELPARGALRPSPSSSPGVELLPGGKEGEPGADPAARQVSMPGIVRDPVTNDQSAKILYSVESAGKGTGSGAAAFSSVLAPLRLEPWEVRAVRRILEVHETQGGEAPRDRLFLDSAALRLRMDEEARILREPRFDQEPKAEAEKRLAQAGRCLVRAQELDRLFRAEIEDAVGIEESELLHELYRSRFRLIRAFSGLWLLHNQHVKG